MRSLSEIRLVNAKAVVREAEERREDGGVLSLVEAAEALRALAEIRRAGEGKQERNERWLRRKAESKTRFWRQRGEQ